MMTGQIGQLRGIDRGTAGRVRAGGRGSPRVPAVRASVIALSVVACSDVGQPPVTQGLPDTADQIIFGTSLNMTIDGVLRVKLEADTAFFYESSRKAELKGVQVQFLSPQGTVSSTVTSREGTYDWRSSNMEARGDVVAVTPDGRRLTTTILRYDRAREEISGPEPFMFDAPDRHLEGDGFTSDPDFRNVVTTRPRRGRAGDVEVRPR